MQDAARLRGSPNGGLAAWNYQVKITRNARIKTVDTSQSCMVDQPPLKCKRTVLVVGPPRSGKGRFLRLLGGDSDGTAAACSTSARPVCDSDFFFSLDLGRTQLAVPLHF